MATYSLDSFDIWKWVTGNWTSVIFYGTDMWEVNFPSWTRTIYEPTTTYDLAGFQPGHRVCITLVNVKRTWPWSAVNQSARLVLWGVDWGWNVEWLVSSTSTISRPALWTGATSEYSGVASWIVGLDIPSSYTKYVFRIYSVDWDSWDFTSPEITLTNFTADTNRYNPWYIWIDGINLCYTDIYGFVHKVAYDSNYSVNVWVNNKGYIRLDDSDLLRIYYVDENGIAHRTYSSVERAWGWSNVWASNKWYLWAETNWSNAWWLAFVWPNGSKRRIMNWPPAWYV